jgi:hypothetical protein
MRKLHELQLELKAKLAELELYRHSINLSKEDIECISDNYQNALELSYYKQELRDSIQGLRQEIAEINGKQPHYNNIQQEARNKAMYYALPDRHFKPADYSDVFDGEDDYLY